MQAAQRTAISPSSGVRPPRLLVDWEPPLRTFAANIADLFRPEPAPLQLTSAPAPFWPDVFVRTTLPWRWLNSSAAAHAILVTAIVGSWALLRTETAEPQDPIKRDTLTYYQVSEYLPEIASPPPAPARKTRKGQPERAAQRIVSVPIDADNSYQTIVDARVPDVRLKQDVPLPNLMVWSAVPAAAPVAASERSPSRIALPNFNVPVVEPAPGNLVRETARLALPKVPQPAAVEPAPSNVSRELGSINLAHLAPQVEAPKLPVTPQVAASAEQGESQAAPPRAFEGDPARAAGRIMALGVRPIMPTGPVAVPEGNRRGVFAATPDGVPGAPGTPDVVAAGGESPTGAPTSGAGAGVERGTGTLMAGLPPGISVSGGVPPAASAAVVAAPTPRPTAGAAPAQDLRRLMGASAAPVRSEDLARATRAPGSDPSASNAAAEQVFGGRKYYTMALNMPNLTSAGGSWIVRFAEFDFRPGGSDLTAPVPVNKVDPAYPPDLLQQRVEGVVVLYAVIRSDGTVGDIRVLRGVEERLDQNATRALSRWQFRPGTRNGAPVDLEAVVQIPFRVAARRPF